MKIRNEYEKQGIDGFYKNHGHDYENPHESIIKDLISIAKEKNYINGRVMDLCCGSGEISSILLKEHEVIGIDPYTTIAYFNRIGKNPLCFDFKDITQGKLNEKVDTIICSFALHLCPKSLLSTLLWNLSTMAKTLIVLSPNKKPNCDNISGWFLVDEVTLDRVHMKIYMN